MRTAPAAHAIYAAAGAPAGEWEGGVSGRCRLCGGGAYRGTPFAEWLKPTFTDHDLLRRGEIICAACLFCCQERTEYMALVTGREKPQRTRTYSHLVVAGKWVVLGKAQKREMRALLAQSPEVAVIADSGQKHLIFRARPGWWQFELCPPIEPAADRLSRILAATDEIYERGATKDEILTGRYSQGSIRRIGPAEWRALDAMVSPHRGSALLQLAVFLTLRPEEGSPDDGQHALL